MPNMTIDARFDKIRSDLEKYVNTHPDINQYLFSGDYGVIFSNPPTHSSPIPHQLYLYPSPDQKKTLYLISGHPTPEKTKMGELKIDQSLESLSKIIHQGGFFNGKSHNERLLLRNALLTGVDLSSYQAKNAETIHTLNYHITELQKMEQNAASTDVLQKAAKQAKGDIAYLDQEITRTKKNEGRLTSKLGNILQAARQAILEHYKSNPHFLSTYIKEITSPFSSASSPTPHHESTTTSAVDAKTATIVRIISQLQNWQTEKNKDLAKAKYSDLIVQINYALDAAKKTMTLIEKMSKTPPVFVEALNNIKESVEACHATLQALAITKATDAFSRPESGNTDPLSDIGELTDSSHKTNPT